MKLNGVKVQGPNIEYIVIPRGNGNDIVLKAQAVLDTKEFEQIVQAPKPGKKMLPGGIIKEDADDPIYKDAMKAYADLRYSWIVIQSLKATEGLEWETVDEGRVDTWNNWETELKDAGFSNTEVQYVMLGVANANALNQEKIDEARTRFLLSVADQPKV